MLPLPKIALVASDYPRLEQLARRAAQRGDLDGIFLLGEINRADIVHLFKARRSFASMKHVARLLLRHARDRMRHHRGTRLVFGNATALRSRP